MLLPGPQAERRDAAPVRLRLQVWARRERLDEALADGASPRGDAALSLRARQLGATRTRLAIARSIANVLDAAEEPPSAWAPGGPRPPLRRESIRAARHELELLCGHLRGPEPMTPQAVALAARLVWDSASPMYAPGAAVAEWADAALTDR